MNPTDPNVIPIVLLAAFVSAAIGFLLAAVLAASRLYRAERRAYEKGRRDAEDLFAAHRHEDLKDSLAIRPAEGETPPPVPDDLRRHFATTQIRAGK